MAFLFENLRVYRKAIEFSEGLWTLTEAPPKRTAFLADQLRRAANSVTANIAEGSGRSRAQDRQHFFLIARGSILECVAHLNMAKHTGMIDPSIHARLRSDIELIARMLTRLIQSQKQQTRL